MQIHERTNPLARARQTELQARLQNRTTSTVAPLDIKIATHDDGRRGAERSELGRLRDGLRNVRPLYDRELELREEIRSIRRQQVQRLHAVAPSRLEGQIAKCSSDSFSS